MRVGLVGSVSYQEIPRTVMDYLTMIVTGVLVAIVLYILQQICFPKNEGMTADEDNFRAYYRELPGDN